MKIRNSYILREVAGNHVVVPTGNTSVDFSGVITLNDTGAYLWKLLGTEKTEQELLFGMLKEYEIDEATAKADLSEFLVKLKAADLCG